MTATKRKREVSFKVSKADRLLVTDAVERVAQYEAKNGRRCDRLSVAMDLEATHANGCPLNFEKLLTFDDLSFLHDIYGINRHLNRETGELMHCFLPRCAKNEAPSRRRRRALRATLASSDSLTTGEQK